MSLSRRHFLVSAAGTALTALSGCAPRTSLAQGAAGGLRSPFPPRALEPRTLKPDYECGPVPAPVTRLKSISKYDQDDPSRSKIDPRAEAELREENQPVTDFVRGLTKATDELLLDPINGGARAACAWSWMAAWAQADALRGPNVAEATRKWELGTIASSVLKLRGSGIVPDAAQQNAVQAWIGRLAENVRDDYSRGTNLPSRRNNHLYWAAWAVTASAIVVDDTALFDWGLERYHYALGQIEPDGHLPLETARGDRALGYHSFALLPLVMIAEAGEANDRALYQAQEGRLLRLAGFLLDNYQNPQAMDRLAGRKQDLQEGLNPRSMAWLEPYYARTRDPRALPWIARSRPLAHRSAGGNLTAMFGVPLAGAIG